MRDLWTLTRKEFREGFYNRTSLFRYFGIGLIFAVLFPLQQAGSGMTIFVTSCILWVAYSSVIMTTGATIQAFYVEKVKKTIETLLATPLSDLALFGGKALYCFLLSFAGIVLSLVAQLVVFNVAKLIKPGFLGASGAFMYPGMALFGLLVTLPCLLLYVVNMGTLISLKVANIRMANLLTMFSFVPLFAILTVFHPALTWPFVLQITAFLLVVDAVVFVLAVKWFRRETVILSMA